MLLRKCIGAHRFFWNKAKAFVDEEYERAKEARLAVLEAEKHMGCAYISDAQKKCLAMKADGKACGKKATVGHGCKDHGDAQGCERMPPIRCGEPLTGDDSYFCDQHQCTNLGINAQRNGYSIYSHITMRDVVLPSEGAMTPEEEWQKDIPYDTRQGAIKKYAGALSGFFERRKGDPHTQPPGFLKKRSRATKTFAVAKKAISFNNGKLRVFPTRTGKKVMRVAYKDLKRMKKVFAEADSVASDAEICLSPTGKWYIILPRKVTPKSTCGPIWNSPAYNSVFLDPGGRTFQTFYSPDGVAGKLGDDFYIGTGIKDKLQKSDRLMSKASALKNGGVGRGRTRRNILARAQALRTKVHDTVRDLHRKTARFLCDNFKNIFIPDFRAPEMTRLGRRVLHSSAVRNLTTFAHSEFRNKLIEYSKGKGCNVIVVSEAYTTKTCTGCGHLMNVGDRRTVSCPECHLELDRDISGSRNCFLRLATQVG